MKNNIKILSTVVATVFIVLLSNSCSEKLDKTDPNRLTVDQYYKNSAQLLAAVNSIYSTAMSAQLVSREWFYVNDTRSDEFAAGGRQLESPRRQILEGAAQPNNPLLRDVWSGFYGMIHRANTVLDNAVNVDDNTALRDRIIGEAKFFRAWAYFELVTTWGPVPMYSSVVKGADQFSPRMPVAQVYELIEKDLKEAASALPSKSGYAPNDLGRVTKGAANAMLGRVYVQQLKFVEAKPVLQAVISSGDYRLANDYADNFDEEHEFNAESIFEVIFYSQNRIYEFNWGTAEGADVSQSTVRNQEYCPVAWRNLIPSNKYLNTFENIATGAAKTDPRFSKSVYVTGDLFNNGNETLTADQQNGNSSVINGITKKASWRKYTLIYKYSSGESGFFMGGINQRILRLAEVYLLLAECENELGNQPAAIAAMNIVRARTGVAMPPYPTTQYPCNNKAAVFTALNHEKMVELGGEEIRSRDIMRWRKQGYFTTDPYTYFKANRDELLPIPQQEIDNNPKLGDGGISKQNPGY